MGRIWMYAAIGIGLAVLLSTWHRVSRLLTVSASAQGRVVSQWSASGSPQEDLMHTRRFMYEVAQEAKTNPEVKPVQANLYYSSTSSRDDVIFISFLAGHPPDLVDFWIGQMSDAVAAGQIRPVEDLIEREDRIRKQLGLPTFIAGLPGGEQALVRFNANPRDWRIQAWLKDGSCEVEASRLLGMHGKIIGFNPPGRCATLTYNGRLFQEAAAKGGKYAELVDAAGKARPPRTWTELRRFARLITEWGIETYGVSHPDRPYGIIFQGQAPSDMMRGFNPLAVCADGQGFDFRSGRYAFDSDATIGTLALMLRLRQDGSVRPGTEQRHYEITRAELAQGRAAMLIDGLHAAMIGAQANPAAKGFLGSAPVPVPYDTEDEKAELVAWLGFPVGRGVWSRGSSNAKITCLTTGSEHPESAWDWMNRGKRHVAQMRTAMLEHFGIPDNRTSAFFAFESQEPEWIEFRKKLQPFQFQAWAAVEQAQVWPSPPTFQAIEGYDNEAVVLREAFMAVSPGCTEAELQTTLARTRERLRTYSQAVNERLTALEAEGSRDRSRYTFPDWDATRPADFYFRQLSGASPEQLAEVKSLQQRVSLPLSEVNRIIQPSATPLLLSIAGMLLAVVIVYILWQRFLGAGRQPGGMAILAREARRNWQGYVFVAPAMVGLFVFVLYPAVYQVILSLHSGTGQSALRWVGGANYTRSFGDEVFWGRVIPNTLLYMVVVATGSVAVSLGLGCLLNLPLRGNNIYRTLFFVPMVVSITVVAVIFFGLLAGPKSTVNGVLDSLGFYQDGSWLNSLAQWVGLLPAPVDGVITRIDWLNDPRVALWTLMVVAIWQGLPYNTILCLAGLQSISKDLYEAARIDGAGVWARFWRITVPQLAPIIIILLFNSLVGAARHFGNVYILTKGNNGTEIVATYIFKLGFEWNDKAIPDLGYASTLSILYALLLSGLILVNVIYVARRLKRRYTVAGGGGAP